MAGAAAAESANATTPAGWLPLGAAQACYYARILDCGHNVIPGFDLFGQALALANCAAVALGAVAVVLQRHWRRTSSAAAARHAGGGTFGGSLAGNIGTGGGVGVGASSLSAGQPEGGVRSGAFSVSLDAAAAPGLYESGASVGDGASAIAAASAAAAAASAAAAAARPDRLETCLGLLTLSCVPSAVAMVLSAFFNSTSVVF
ncbi:hypothetical protein HK405_008514, partial [Cladochytrium tenue]